MTSSKRQAVLIGARDTLPLVVAAMPFGVVYGAMAQTAGLSLWATLGMSAFVYAGSAQFIAVTLLGASAAIPVILLTVFVVNARHLLYSASLMPHASRLPHWFRVPMAFWLTDETFAVVSNRLTQQPPKSELPWYYLGSALLMYGNWLACTGVGVVLGHRIPDLTHWGLDVAMIVAFIGIVVPALRRHSHWACALVAGVSALLTHDWPNQSGLLFSAVLAIVVGAGLEKVSEVRHG
ncbi:AzlC family ABC transporter permease [Mangrovitalea sediminis]|uniref:AzlC family ABC transporter permease n=1 Tax=Mangrovitalea sediminis TaxID=1982043 RepID=UPI001D0D3E9E|nr:AzlC family ABC transporter permease [Mangrovitalea sediminis]